MAKNCRRLHVFSSSSDWFIGLSAYVVTGQGNHIGFAFGFKHSIKNWSILSSVAH